MRRPRQRTEWERSLVLFLIIAAGATMAGLIVATIVGAQLTARLAKAKSESPLLKLLGG